MNTKELLFKDYLSQVSDRFGNENVTWRGVLSSDGYKGSITVKHSDFNKENAAVCIHRKVLSEEVSVTIMFIGESGSGWHGIPYSGELYGERLAELPLEWVFKLLPTQFEDRMVAEKYLAEDPSMLIAKLSNVLTTQKNIINHQQDVIVEVDDILSKVLSKATGKCKTLLNLYSKSLTRKKFSDMKDLQKLLLSFKD